MPQENIHIVHRLFNEAWNQGKFHAVDNLLAPDFVNHKVPPGSARGIDGYKQNIRMLRSAFPDIEYTFDQIIGEGDRVAMRFSVKGTHKGPFMGFAPITGLSRSPAWRSFESQMAKLPNVGDWKT